MCLRDDQTSKQLLYAQKNRGFPKILEVQANKEKRITTRDMKSFDQLKYLFFIEQLDFFNFAKTEEFDVYYVPSDMGFQPLTIFEVLSIFERVLDTPLTGCT